MKRTIEQIRPRVADNAEYRRHGGIKDGSEKMTMVLDVCNFDDESSRGRSLQQLLSDSGQGLPSSVVAAIARQMAEALRVLHQGRIVHHDIKPSNVWITDRAYA